MLRVWMFDAGRDAWLNFSEPTHILAAYRVDEVLPVLRIVESHVANRGLYAAGFISYEAAPAFDAALCVRRPDPAFPLLWFGLFRSAKPMTLPPPSGTCKLAWRPDISRSAYHTAIERIKHLIAAGETYQVNYSFRLKSPFRGEPIDLFLQLAAAQPSRNAAYIETETFAICSASPELFFSLEDKTIVARPMKGTMPRALTPLEDAQQAIRLQTSEKNRAENVMIVDMMRNDLGRIAEIGSIEVPFLFTIERYPTVWQMTSTVQARTDALLSDILCAVFPCASITGAPKPRTMQIIAELESSPRHLYTGALGFIAPERRAQFNVAIRTVLVNRCTLMAEYGVGGGIVWDSTTEGEYEECLTKARVLTDVRPSFELLETILFTPENGFFLLDEHLERLRSSCGYFDFSFDERAVLKALLDAVQGTGTDALRIRLTLGSDGSPRVTATPMSVHEADVPVRLRFAAAPVDSHHHFLYHKTTHRTLYEEALRNVGDCDDVILWNERGEITESTNANIVVELDGVMYTPPVASGVLPGTFRQRLLRDGCITERVMKREDVVRSRQLFLINSVRKWRKAMLV